MQSNITDILRANLRIDVLSKQLRESEHRESNLRQDNDALKARVANLLAQKKEPQSMDEVVHGVQDPAKGGE